MISGSFTLQFKDANLAVTTEVHMSSDVPKSFKIIKIDGDVLTLEHPKYGDGLYQILKGENYEYVEFEHNGLYSKMISSKPETYKVMPFISK